MRVYQASEGGHDRVDAAPALEVLFGDTSGVHMTSAEIMRSRFRDVLSEQEGRIREIIREEISNVATPVVREAGTDEVLTTEESAREAKCSEKTIRRACKRGLLIARKPVGMSEWRIRRVDLLAWIAASRHTSAPSV